MNKLRKALPLIAIIAVAAIFLRQHNRDYPIAAVFMISFSAIVLGFVSVLVYYIVCSKLLHIDNKWELKFKHFAMIALILMSLSITVDSPKPNADGSYPGEKPFKAVDENGWESHANDPKTVFCPHCNGTGQRINNLTGENGKCSSCGGSGMVSKWQSDHYIN